MATKKTPDEIYPISEFITDLSITLTTEPPSHSPPTSISARRLIFIGDVHGSRKTLEALLNKVDFDKAKGDEIFLVGDLVNKGPDSGGVIDLAGEIGARAVRGNHDNAVLLASSRLKAELADTHGGKSQREQRNGDDEGGKVEEKKKTGSMITAEKLSALQVDFLASLPLIIRIHLTPCLPGIDDIVVVHAGLVPGIPMEKQSPHAVMHMRSLSGEGAELVPMEETGEQGWVVDWDKWQEGCVEKTMVVFGHDAKRRLQRGRYTVGLDTACCYGLKLSAWVVEMVGGKVQERVVDVDCAEVEVAGS